MAVSSKRIKEKEYFLRGNKKILFVIAVLVLMIGGRIFQPWVGKQLPHHWKITSKKAAITIPLGFPGPVCFKTGREVYRVQLDTHQWSAWIFGIPGTHLIIDEPENGWTTVDPLGKKEITTLYGEAKRGTSTSVRIKGGGGDGYATVWCSS